MGILRGGTAIDMSQVATSTNITSVRRGVFCQLILHCDKCVGFIFRRWLSLQTMPRLRNTMESGRLTHDTVRPGATTSRDIWKYPLLSLGGGLFSPFF